MSATANALDFTGKRVLVTGGGRGIGKAVVKKFVELGAQVFALDKDAEALAELTAELPSVKTLKIDVSDWDATRRAVQSILPIHHLANNCGIVQPKPLLDTDLSDLNAHLDVNFKGIVNVATVVAKGMIEHKVKNGTIVNSSSVVDSLVLPTVGIYTATKAAITMLTKTMAVEWAPYGIRVNCLRAAMVRTEMIVAQPPEVQEMICGPFIKRMLSQSLLETEDVANSLVFLSSPLASRITGSALTVDDGYGIQ